MLHSAADGLVWSLYFFLSCLSYHLLPRFSCSHPSFAFICAQYKQRNTCSTTPISTRMTTTLTTMSKVIAKHLEFRRTQSNPPRKLNESNRAPTVGSFRKLGRIFLPSIHIYLGSEMGNRHSFIWKGETTTVYLFIEFQKLSC